MVKLIELGRELEGTNLIYAFIEKLYNDNHLSTLSFAFVKMKLLRSISQIILKHWFLFPT